MGLVLGIDVGTQGVRALVANDSGLVLAQSKNQFAHIVLPNLPPGHIEQEPADWWGATQDCLRSIVVQLRDRGREPADITAAAVDSTSGTVVLLDEQHRALRPAIMYNDRRADHEAQEINQVAEAHYRKLGYRFNSSFALPKLLWLARREPENWARARRVAHAADYIAGKLTGIYDVSDQGNALKTGFDLIDFAWPPFIEKDLGIDSSHLPRINRTGEDVARVSRECATETGLAEITRVVAGTTDGSAEQFASGARQVGDWNTVLGTTLVLKGLTSDLVIDPVGRGVYCHRHPMGYWMPGGASNVGARALDDRFPHVDRRALDRAALTWSPTSLSVYPLAGRGERFPFNAPNAMGFFEGEPASDEERYAAILEGIAFVERLGYELLRSLGAIVGPRLYATGGGAQSIEWMQMRADLMNTELARAVNATAAMGSAIVAASNTLFSDIAAASAAMVHIERMVEPRRDMTVRYEAAYQRFLTACRRRGYMEETV